MTLRKKEKVQNPKTSCRQSTPVNEMSKVEFARYWADREER